MSDSKDSTVAFRLKPSDPPAHPDATNYTSVGVAQCIAYPDSGFIEPTQLAAIVKTAKDSLGQNTEERNGIRNSFLTV